MSNRIYIIPTIFEDEGLTGKILKSYGFRIFNDSNSSYATFCGGKEEFIQFLNSDPEEVLTFVRGYYNDSIDEILEFLQDGLEINGEWYSMNSSGDLIFKYGTKIGSDKFIREVKES